MFMQQYNLIFFFFIFLIYFLFFHSFFRIFFCTSMYFFNISLQNPIKRLWQLEKRIYSYAFICSSCFSKINKFFVLFEGKSFIRFFFLIFLVQFN